MTQDEADNRAAMAINLIEAQKGSVVELTESFYHTIIDMIWTSSNPSTIQACIDALEGESMEAVNDELDFMEDYLTQEGLPLSTIRA